MNQKYNYWKEAIECAMDSIGCFKLLTDEQYEKIAESLEISADCKSMAFGTDCIPNPEIQEKKNLESQHQREVKEKDQEIKLLKKLIGRDRNIDPTRISTNRDTVFYSDGRTNEIYYGGI